jgi:hypothetical protein
MEIGERHDSVWEPVNEDASVNGTDKGVSGGEAEVADTKATEAAETAAEVAEAAAEAAMTTPHRRCLVRSRKIEARKPDRVHLPAVNVKTASASGANPS